MFLVHGEQLCILGNSGSYRRADSDFPFLEAFLILAQRQVYTSMAFVRVLVEWMGKEMKLYCTTLDFFLPNLNIGKISDKFSYFEDMP